MRTRVLEHAGHLYLQTLPDIWDFLAVVSSFASIIAIMLMVWQAVALLQRKPQQRLWQVRCALVIVCGVGYTILYMLDVPGVLAIISNGGGDIPIRSTIRTLFIVGLLFTLARVLNGATRPSVEHAAK